MVMINHKITEEIFLFRTEGYVQGLTGVAVNKKSLKEFL